MQMVVRVLAAVAVVSAFTMQMVGGLNSDVSWLLTVSERMLDGQQLYIDIYELNPPMSAFLYLPYVALARTFGLTPELITVSAILLLVLLSSAFSIRLIRQEVPLSGGALLWLILVVALTILPGRDFGQREHIAVILLLPAIAVSVLRSMGRSPRPSHSLLAGVAIGLVMTIKPHFALPVLFVALASAAHARSWRPILNEEHVLGGVILAVYCLVVWTCFPSFFSTMLPLASAAYLADRQSLLNLLLGRETWLSWLMIVSILLLYRRDMRNIPNLQLLAAAAGFFMVFVLQGKGFGYHALPVQILVSVVFARCLLAGSAGIRLAALPLALMLVAAPAALTYAAEGARQQLKAVLTPLGRGLRIANLTTELSAASPLHRDLGGTLINSGPCLWIALGALRRSASTSDPVIRAEMTNLENLERDLLREDLLANPPDVILIGKGNFDWVGWAKQDAEISELLDNYEVLPVTGAETLPVAIWHLKME